MDIKGSIKKVCGMTTQYPTVVGTSVLLLGLGHFGKDSGLMNMSVGPVSVGMIAGGVGVAVGSCMILNRFM